MRRLLKSALIWGTTGVGIAVFLLVVSLFTDVLAPVELVLWPGSFGFMALDNSTATRLDWVEGTAFLIFTNFVLYFVVGFLLALGYKALRRLTERRPLPRTRDDRGSC
jgi:hypothetical protein